MEKREQLYAGKAKSIYKTDDPDHEIMLFRNDTSAIDGKRIDQAVGGDDPGIVAAFGGGLGQGGGRGDGRQGRRRAARHGAGWRSGRRRAVWPIAGSMGCRPAAAGRIAGAGRAAGVCGLAPLHKARPPLMLPCNIGSPMLAAPRTRWTLFIAPFVISDSKRG